MKRIKILLAIIMVLQLFFSCKKDGSINPPQVPPPGEKKWVVTTIAGDGRPVFADGSALEASFRDPLDVVVAPDGSIYIADALNHRIRKMADGRISSFVGTSTADTTSGDASIARFVFPDEITTNSTGEFFTLDVEDPRVRKISLSGSVSVHAGSGIKGFNDGPATTAQFGEEASGIAADTQGNIYVCDYDNRRVRSISNNGNVTTVAGNGNQGFVDGRAESAEFYSLGGIAIDNQGNLFVADWTSIRKITPGGIVSTFAGSHSIGYKDGQASEALFGVIGDLAMDERGNIYVTDNDRVRMITSQGMVSTIAGSTPGYEDGDGAAAKFKGAYGLGMDKAGNIYVADSENNRIRKISFQ